MRKLVAFLLIHLLLFVSSCFCPSGGWSATYTTIHSVDGFIYSFGENGIAYIDEINRDEINREKLGIRIFADSTSQRVEFAQAIVKGNQLYACEDNNYYYYTNRIESLNIYTIFDFDDNHPALTNINDILRPFNIYGEILDVNDLSLLHFTEEQLKFIKSPTYDTLQFEITGKINEGEDFRILTKILILE